VLVDRELSAWGRYDCPMSVRQSLIALSVLAIAAVFAVLVGTELAGPGVEWLVSGRYVPG
jgi:hypothetical protein